jgi:hypothetical protein
MKVICKLDLVSEVLKQLGGNVPHGDELKKVVVAASDKLKREAGLQTGDKVCLFLSPISGAALK